MNRSEKTMYGAAGAVLIAALLAYMNLDKFLSDDDGQKGKSLGRIQQISGDVRHKESRKYAWEDAQVGETLSLNDSIFAGKNATTRFDFDENEIEIQNNTLVVLKQSPEFKSLDLHLGMLAVKLKKNSTMNINLGGQRIKLSSDDVNSVVKIKKSPDGHVSVVGISGAAKIQKPDGSVSPVNQEVQLKVAPEQPGQSAFEDKDIAQSLNEPEIFQVAAEPALAAEPELIMEPPAPPALPVVYGDTDLANEESTLNEKVETASEVQTEPANVAEQAAIEFDFEDLSGRPQVTGEDLNQKYPHKIKWNRWPKGTNYIVEISTDPSFRKMRAFPRKSTSFPIMVYPGKKYYWRVQGATSENTPATELSKPFEFEIPYEKSQPEYAYNEPVTNQEELGETPLDEEPERDLSSTPEDEIETQQSKVSIDTKDYSFNRLEDPFWIWLGAGYNFIQIKQSYETVGSLDSQNLMGTSLFVEGGKDFSQGYGALVSYKTTPGKYVSQGSTIDGSAYTWNTLTLEGSYNKKHANEVMGYGLDRKITVGVQSHSMPFVSVDDSSVSEGQKLSMQTFTAGVGFTNNRTRWSHEMSLRYQHPILSSFSGGGSFSVSPIFSFDGLLGSSYYLTENAKLGLFWYGQWHQYSYDYSTSAFQNKGSQSLFFSNLDFRLGYEF